MSLAITFLIKNKALRYPLFRKYLLSRFSLIMSLNMQTTIIVYWVYTLTNDVSSVGLLGLFEAVPAIGFSMISGHFVDQREKRNLMLQCVVAYLVLAVGYLLVAQPATGQRLGHGGLVPLIYAGIFIGGTIRAFLSPTSFSMMGMLVPRRLYPNAATWSSTSWMLGAVVGPLLGGLMIGYTSVPVSLALVLGIQVVAFIAVRGIPRQPILKKVKEPVLQSLQEGMRFVFRNQLILATLSLDMFAVLLGGATALLPAFARDILKVGEIGFGWLRAAPGIGSILMIFILSWTPIKTKPGIKLLGCITGFGACIVVFGLSRSFMLSFAALMASGMFDAVSVVIRSTILQLHTPDAMRGRVSAVNTMFVSSSNELGEVESGFTAKWLGAVPSVVLGGCLTMVVVGVTWLAAPRLRTLKLEVPEERTD